MGKAWGSGDICNSVNIKHKVKKFITFPFSNNYFHTPSIFHITYLT